MNINRHNYEEYFILYMDNELGSDERRMVEAFIDKNADLKEELELLLQYKLVPDNNIVFEGKEELMKLKEQSPVTLSNYEEWIVLYMDNELSAEQRKIVEQFIAANPLVKKEANLLLRTQLQPETIVFANKETLYRKEENPDSYRARPVLWWRVAAAVLILLLGTTAVIIMNKKGTAGKEEIATVPADEQKIKKENPVVTNNTNQEATEEVKQAQVPIITNSVRDAVAAVPKTNNTNAVEKKETTTSVKLNIPAPIKKNEEMLAENNKKTNDLPQPLNNRNSLINNAPNNNAIAKADILKEIKNADNLLTNTKVTNDKLQASDIQTASFTNTDDTNFNQSNSKKNKLRGFFRKVTRTFEKRTNIDPTDDDEKLLLGGLAIRLK
jgi:hypothetical protein